MDDESILRRIHTLIDQEHEFRTSRQNGTVDEGAEARELRDAEVEPRSSVAVERCWQ